MTETTVLVQIAKLETKVEHIDANFKEVKDDFKSMKEKVEELHEIMTQAKGARWAILSIAAFAGFLSANLKVLLTFVMGK